MDDSVDDAGRRLQLLVKQVQREINATIDATYVIFSSEAKQLFEPAHDAQKKLKVEARKLGFET